MSGPVRGQPVTLNTLRDVDPTGITDGAVPTWNPSVNKYVLTTPGATGSHTPIPAKDKFTLTGPTDTTHKLSALPVNSAFGSSLILTLNKLTLVEGDDYTVNYSTAVVTVLVTLVAGDVLYAQYWTTGALAASRLVEWAGTTNFTGSWGMSAATVGRRVSGIWTYTTIPQGTLANEGVADAYSVESTVLAAPVGAGNFFDWLACSSDWSGALTGIRLETDNSTTTLYLYQAGSQVLSSFMNAVPVTGDDVHLVTDFTTKVATVYRNGASWIVLNFSSATWFSAGMVAP